MSYDNDFFSCDSDRKNRETIKKYEKGIRVAALCEYMGGISEQAVYKWERGACLPTIDNLLALSHLYHVQMEDLLVYEEAEMASSCFISEYRGDISGTVSGYACTAA